MLCTFYTVKVIKMNVPARGEVTRGKREEGKEGNRERE